MFAGFFIEEGRIERSEEEILQNGIVVVAVRTGNRVEIFENSLESSRREKVGGDKMLLADKPHEKQSCYEADYLDVDVLAIVEIIFGVVGKIDAGIFRDCPAVPVIKFCVEFLGKRLHGKDFTDCGKRCGLSGSQPAQRSEARYCCTVSPNANVNRFAAVAAPLRSQMNETRHTGVSVE